VGKSGKTLKFRFHGVLEPERSPGGRDPFLDALTGIRDVEGRARTMAADDAFFRVPEFVDLGGGSVPWLAGRFARYATDLDVVIGDVDGGFRQVSTDESHGAQSPESYFLYDPSLRVLCFQNNPQAHVKRFERYVAQVAPAHPDVKTKDVLNEEFLKSVRTAERILAVDVTCIKPNHGDFYEGDDVSLRDFTSGPAALGAQTFSMHAAVYKKSPHGLHQSRVVDMVSEILRIRQTDRKKLRSAKVVVDNGGLSEEVINLFKAGLERKFDVPIVRRLVRPEEVYTKLREAYADAVPELSRQISREG